MTSIELFSLPGEAPDSLRGKSAVPVDVLRAGTTIITALFNGAAAVVPCVDVDTTRTLASKTERSLLGGERRGLPIKGFSLSNSPEDYRKETVQGRCIYFSTTNGTLAIDACRSADRILIGSFVNLTAVCEYLSRTGSDISIVCAGTDGMPTLEDNLLGGAICDWLNDRGNVHMNPAARAASEMWRTTQRQIAQGSSLCEILCHTLGGKNLVRLNLAADIEFAATIDRFDQVPVFDPNQGQLRTDMDPAGTHR